MQAVQGFQPFDLGRMLLGEQAGLLYLAEIVLRTVVMYGYALVFARVIGSRGVGQISPFEFILIIIISSAAGDPMFYHHVPLLHGILVLTVVMLLHQAVSYLTNRSEGAEDVLEGEPVLVIENGEVVETALGKRTFSRRELMMQLRHQSIRDVGEVHRAYFEPDGRISIFQADSENRRQRESTSPHAYRRDVS